ncbi:MAG: NADH-quinone oxidoreductase subunit J family protein [Candidatus Hodarchaeales archaeon]|jgi:NADH-quinone oxidoreductase subunit J
MALFPSELFQALEFAVFLVLIGYTLGSAFLAVSVKSVYHAVLWLIFSLLGIAMIFLLYADSALLLVVQMIVYAGGITVLMLFAISLSGKDAIFEKNNHSKLMDRRLSFGAAFILLVIVFYVLYQLSSNFWQDNVYSGLPEDAAVKLLEAAAVQLFTTHGGTIIVLGLLLLATMLGSVYLVKKEVEGI